jgi:hypothetical protein
MGKAELEGHVMFRSAGVRRGMSRMAGQKRKGQLWTAMVRAWGFGQKRSVRVRRELERTDEVN